MIFSFTCSQNLQTRRSFCEFLHRRFIGQLFPNRLKMVRSSLTIYENVSALIISKKASTAINVFMATGATKYSHDTPTFILMWNHCGLKSACRMLMNDTI